MNGFCITWIIYIPVTCYLYVVCNPYKNFTIENFLYNVCLFLVLKTNFEDNSKANIQIIQIKRCTTGVWKYSIYITIYIAEACLVKSRVFVKGILHPYPKISFFCTKKFQNGIQISVGHKFHELLIKHYFDCFDP